MAARKILIVDGHPDPDPARFVHALADAYAEGAARHQVRRLKLADMDIPLLRSAAEWMTGEPPAGIAEAQADIAWADHVVIIYPLWLGDVPALLKAFLEQAMRPGFALDYREHGLPRKLLAGRSARVVVTMGMPALVYRHYFRAHAVRALERNVLGFVGIAPVHETLVGGVEATSAEQRAGWLDKLRALGRKAA
jgi:putative NADPH-quinone reductase